MKEVSASPRTPAPAVAPYIRPSHADIRVKDGDFPTSEHPLETSWTLWCERKVHARQSTQDYIKNLKQIATFNTIEGFFRHYSYLKRAADLPQDFNVALFRKGCRPMWEDFPRGGCWIIRVSKRSPNAVNSLWESLLLACIGEVFEMPELAGIHISARAKEDVISVWNDSNENPLTRVRICERIREICQLDTNTLIQYKDNASSMRDMSTYRNARYYVVTATPTSEPASLVSRPLPGGHELTDVFLPPSVLSVPEESEEAAAVHN